ncbi:MAG: site-specific DNA-methyltransferase [Bacteroidetes bacterium SB0662_bin_6]|nr:site-specific DNA-methyltransferase [Bacteroidetes bacterium SB0668_bin_1]MYE04642.1 site-specific DNA-methyltransferase [Bacteroidetes bacterium SB0662_bin_6]
MIDTIKQGDCIELMAEMPDGCVDLVITDPPFAIDFKAVRHNYNRKGSRVLKGYSEVAKNDYQAFTLAWLSEATRLLKDSGSMYIFSGWNHLKEILIAIDECKLTTVNHLIWKYQFGVVTKRKYVTSHYHCLFVCKDDKKRQFSPYCRFDKDAKTPSGGSAHYEDKEDVWTINREYWTGAVKTPTKLPAALIEKILDYSSKKGDLVMDPFLGSGQVAIVSKMKERHYVGFEIVPEYYDFARDRLASGKYLIQQKKQPEIRDLFSEGVSRSPSPHQVTLC